MRGTAAIAIGACVLIASCGSSAKHATREVTTVSTVGSTTTSSTSVTASSQVAVLQAYIDAFNREDATAAAAKFSTSATFSTPLGTCAPCVGRSTIEQKLAAAIAAGTKIEMVQAQLAGNTVTARSTLTSPRFPPGVKRAIGSFTATVSDGAITQFTQTYDRTDPQTAALFKSLGL